MKKTHSFRLIFLLGIAALFVGSGSRFAGPRNQDKPTYQTTGSEGKLTGKVSFVGQAPEPKRIDRSADPVCQADDQDLFTEDMVVSRGKLANVLVYVESGDALEWYVFEAPRAEVSIAHQNCQLVPHVLGLQIQQTLKISNADATTHNTHLIPKLNPDWNQSQAANSEPLQHKFTSPEIDMPLKDNQHPWERAYVSVFSHPFFSVSGRDGSFQIFGLPPGQYTIVAWHERLGEQTAEISIGVRETKTLDFAFKPREK